MFTSIWMVQEPSTVTLQRRIRLGRSQVSNFIFLSISYLGGIAYESAFDQ